MDRQSLLLLLAASLLFTETSAQRSCIKCTTSTFACMLGTKAPDLCSIPDDLCTVRIVEGFFGNGVTTRGCLGDIEDPAERARCEDPEDFSCVTCGDGDACNNHVWRSCHMCQEVLNETCAGEQQMILDAQYCGNYREPNLCYERFVDGKVERGCEADLDGEEACVGNEECLVCDRDACNKDDSVTFKGSLCHQCDSLSDPDCAAGTTEPTHCGQEDVCITRVVDGVLERGCLSILNEEDHRKCQNPEDDSCLMCDTESCNTIRWLQCHQCNGTSACNEQQYDSERKFCRNYVTDNRCYERIEDHMVTRGCEADLVEGACETSLECRSCETDLCNKEAAHELHTRQRCQQCNTLDDVDGICLLGVAPTKPCTVESGGKCYSRIDSDGVLHRGCLGNLSTEEAQACSTETCSICEVEDCNKGLFPENRLECYQCKTSETDSSCSDKPKSAYCQTYDSEDRCYTRLLDEVLVRGCQSDLGMAVKACDKLDNKRCRLCDGANCNAISPDELNNFASKLAFDSKLVALVVVVMLMVVYGVDIS